MVAVRVRTRPPRHPPHPIAIFTLQPTGETRPFARLRANGNTHRSGPPPADRHSDSGPDTGRRGLVKGRLHRGRPARQTPARGRRPGARRRLGTARSDVRPDRSGDAGPARSPPRRHQHAHHLPECRSAPWTGACRPRSLAHLTTASVANSGVVNHPSGNRSRVTGWTRGCAPSDISQIIVRPIAGRGSSATSPIATPHPEIPEVSHTASRTFPLASSDRLPVIPPTAAVASRTSSAGAPIKIGILTRA